MSTVELVTADGLKLEAHRDGHASQRGVVLCHPHPRMGGTMNAPLLDALTQHLVSRDWSVLRFNFRGVGASQGTAGTGVDEVADASAAIRLLAAEVGTVALAGWSFGAGVALRAAAAEPVVACATISPAIEGKTGITEPVPPAVELGLSIPVLVVCGANDEQVSPAACRAWASAAGARYLEMPGANHFFWARYEQLSQAIGDWLDEVVPA